MRNKRCLNVKISTHLNIQRFPEITELVTADHVWYYGHHDNYK